MKNILRGTVRVVKEPDNKPKNITVYVNVVKEPSKKPKNVTVYVEVVKEPVKEHNITVLVEKPKTGQETKFRKLRA